MCSSLSGKSGSSGEQRPSPESGPRSSILACTRFLRQVRCSWRCNFEFSSRIPASPERQSRSVSASAQRNRCANWLRQMRAGDETAFATFYDRFAPGLFSMIYAILHDQKESEDVLQEVVCPDVETNRDLRRGPEQPVYLGGDDFATQGHRPLALAAAAGPAQRGRDERNAGAHGPLRRSIARITRSPVSDERERVRAALAQLSDAQREAIELAFFAGLTQTQISEKTGCAAGHRESPHSSRAARACAKFGGGSIVNEELEERAALYVFGLLAGREAPLSSGDWNPMTSCALWSINWMKRPPQSRTMLRHVPFHRQLRERVLSQVRSEKKVAFPPPSQLDSLGHRCLSRPDLRLSHRGANSCANELRASQQRDIFAQIQIASLNSKLANAPNANAVVVWDEKKQRGVLKVTQFPPNAADHDYQLWLVDPRYKNPVDGGVFHVANDGALRVPFHPANAGARGAGIRDQPRAQRRSDQGRGTDRAAREMSASSCSSLVCSRSARCRLGAHSTA